ncbi:MAG: type II secretion system minor pseudopilin GspI, partial [Xanthomonadales bacterium]|nr:type II secretion system minor pseudopilin GspI [Xanthomonadales bacterium]
MMPTSVSMCRARPMAASMRAIAMYKTNSSAGFTLLEVLVALVVLAVALVALTHTAASETAQFSALRERTLAGWVAANALTEVQLQAGLPALGRRSGKAMLAKREWPYRLTVSSTEANEIRRVHVDVYAPGAQAANSDATPVLGMDGFAGASLAR